MKRIVFLLIIISLAPGCLILPVSADHREAIDKVQSQIVVGVTTREEVISILGEPDVTRDRFILYKHKEYNGGMFVGIFIAPMGKTSTVGQVFMDLYFEFDNFGILTDFRADKYDEYLKSVD